ncbi:MAG: signal peptide peptidase SppA [Tannerellaceae bacterium]|nr:signal peptide peptidase SppA [Tannerellaceae bacterium]
MKSFLKTALASAVGVLIASFVLSFISTIFLIGIIAGAGQTKEYKPKNNTVFKLQLTGSISDNADPNPLAALFGDDKEEVSLTQILKSIRLAKENDNIKGIYIESGYLGATPATLQEIRDALEDFKESGKFIYAYSDYYTQGGYYVCSLADSIFLNPSGNISLMGLASNQLFLTGLAEKVGVEHYIFKVGTYKSAVEPYMLKKYSVENREQLESFFGSIWGEITSAISHSRNIAPERLEQFVNDGLGVRNATLTLDYNLADGLVYKHQMEDRLKAAVGLDSKDKLLTAGVDKVVTIKEKKKEHKNKIAVIFAEGVIQESSSSPFSMNDKTISTKFADELLKLKKDEDVKAVVLRVNSPGGSAYISEQIWEAVTEVKKEKPIVVSMGGYAASGGYYISCAANKIIAEPTTLTGSIGIFGVFRNYSGTIDKIGVTSDQVRTNRFSDTGNAYRPMREDEKVLIQGMIEEGYDLFLTRCADGRGLDKTYIDSVGQGRVWTGEQALERKLVDQLGGINDAIKEAALLADVTEYSTIVTKTNKDFITKLLEKQLEDARVKMVKRTLGEDYRLFETLQQTHIEDGLYTRLPFGITYFDNF